MNKTMIHVLQSPSELFEYAREQRTMNKTHNARTYDRTWNGTDFNGKQSSVYEKFAKHKVKEEASLVNDIVSELKSIDFDSVKWEFKLRLTEGDEVDVGRYLDGQERCWNGVRRERKNKKVIRIFCQFGGHCGRSKRELAVQGAVAVTLCEILESMGIGVELWLAEHISGVDYNESINLLECIKVKCANEFSDLGMINYISGNNHVFRNTCFRSWCRFLDENGIDSDIMLGRPAAIRMDMFDDVDSGNCDGTIVVPSIYEVDEAKQWLINTFNERIAK